MILIFLILLTFGILALASGSTGQGLGLLGWAGVIALGGFTFLGSLGVLLVVGFAYLPVALILGK